jgi:hypothetical protein
MRNRLTGLALLTAVLMATAAGGEKIDVKTVLGMAQEMLAEKKAMKDTSRWIEAAAVVAAELRHVDKKASEDLLGLVRKRIDGKLAALLEKAEKTGKRSSSIQWYQAIRSAVKLLEVAIRSPESDCADEIRDFKGRLAAAKNSHYIFVPVVRGMEHVRPELVASLVAGSNLVNVKVPAARIVFDHHMRAGDVEKAVAGGRFLLGKWAPHEPHLAARLCRELAATDSAKARAVAEKCLAALVKRGESRGPLRYSVDYEQLVCAAAGYAALAPKKAGEVRRKLLAITAEARKSSLSQEEKASAMARQHVNLAFLSWLMKEPGWERLFKKAIRSQDALCDAFDKKGVDRTKMFFAPFRGVPEYRTLRNLAEIEPAFVEQVYEKFVKGKTFERPKITSGAVAGIRLLVARTYYARHHPAKALKVVDECYPREKFSYARYPLLLAKVAWHLRISRPDKK